MTCIVGLKTEEGVYIGGDTFGSDRFIGEAYRRPKVFKKDDFIFGVCGSYRVMQLLEFKLNIPDKAEKTPEDKYIYTDFLESVRKCLKDGGHIKLDSGIETIQGAELLFAYRGNLYILQNDLSILEPKSGFAATGSGMYHAQASLFSTEGTTLSAEERITKAIQCANNFVISVNDETNIVFQEAKN